MVTHRISRDSAFRQQEVNVAFDEIIRAVAELSDEERRLLRWHIDQLPEEGASMTPVEKTRRLNVAFDALDNGLSLAQVNEMTAAMTADYIEAWDESEWIQ